MAREHDVLPPVPVFDDAEGILLTFVDGRVGGPREIDLRERAKRPLAGDADLVALHRLFDLAFDGESGAIRLLEPLGRGVAHTLA